MSLKDIDTKIHEQILNIPDSALKLQSTFKMLIQGQSGLGKTEFILKLLASNKMVDEYHLVVYCIPSNTGHLPSVKNVIERLKNICKNIVIHEGMLLDIESVFSPVNDEKALLLYDDLYSELINSRVFSHLATFGSRHANCSLIITSQNIFESSKYSLTIRRQMQYYVIFYPVNEKSTLITLGRSLFPENPFCLLNCFKKLIPNTKSPHEQYLLIDMNPKSVLPYNLRLRSNFFSDEEPYFFLVDD